VRKLRTLENMIDGVVITFTNITEAKVLEARLKKSMPGFASPQTRSWGQKKRSCRAYSV